ncbi:hypothetical protein SAMN04487914_1239 [Arthrobacter sp. ok909]|nr:hypothetical protein SAMN04487914_1239 [Arthrobacter sp. ok909]
MKVILTLVARDGLPTYVDTNGETYDKAKVDAEANIPEGSKAIAIRTT